MTDFKPGDRVVYKPRGPWGAHRAPEDGVVIARSTRLPGLYFVRYDGDLHGKATYATDLTKQET